MTYKMKKRLYTLLISIFVLLVISIFVVLGKKQPEGEYITKEEVLTLVALVDTVLEDRGIVVSTENVDVNIDNNVDEDTKDSLGSALLQQNAVAELEELVSGWDEEEYVTYGQFLQWEKIVSKAWDVPGDEDWKGLSKRYRGKRSRISTRRSHRAFAKGLRIRV